MSLIEKQLQVHEFVAISGQKDNTISVLIQSDQQDKLVGTENLWAVPGLVDIHTHVFPGCAAIGSPADTVGVSTGVSAVVDAGSSGWQNFERFLAESVHPSVTNVYAFLNISPDGLVSEKGELADLRRISVAKTVECARRHSRYIKGIKARASVSATVNTGIAGIELAKEAAMKAELPLMVHVGNGPPAFDEVLDLLGEGDIVTHCFHGKPGGIFLENGSIRPKAVAARERGVRFDVGHGSASLNFAVAKQAIQAGFYPDTISTDIYEGNINGPVFDLVTTANKFIGLGMSKSEALMSCSVVPAQILGIPRAGLTLLEWTDCYGKYFDSDGNAISITGAFSAKYVILNGLVFPL